MSLAVPLLSGALLGHASPALLRSSAQQRPAWVTSTPSKNGLHYFVGTGQTDSEASAIGAACLDALNQAAQSAGAEVRSTYQEEQTSSSFSVSTSTRVAGMASIQGLQMLERYVEQWGEKNKPGYVVVWQLASLSQAAFEQAVQDAHGKLAELHANRQGRRGQMAKALEKAEALMLQGRRQAAAGFADRAREYFQRVQAEMQLLLAGAFSADLELQERAQALSQAANAELGQEGLGLAEFQAAVAFLAKTIREKHMPAAVVRATYQGSAFGGEMGPPLVKLVEDELVRRAPGSVVPSRTFLTRLSKMRVPLEDLAVGMDAGKMGKLGVHSVIYLVYYKRSDGIELDMTLESPSSGVRLANAKALLPQALVGELAPGPPHLEKAEKTLAAFADAESQPGGLTVKLWPDQGESATYAAGEKIVLHARVSKACNLYLIHADSDGRLQLLYPNPWHRSSKVAAGQVLDLPELNDEFDFVATTPFGAEVTVAIASTRPLPSLEPEQTDGFSTLKQGGAGVLKDYLALPEAERGMSRTVYTTVEGK